MTTQHYKLSNLSCPSCTMHLEAMEDSLPGVSHVEASFKKQAMKVEFDEALQSTGGIAEAVAAMGYVAIPTSSEDNNPSKGVAKWTKFFRS